MTEAPDTSPLAQMATEAIRQAGRGVSRKAANIRVPPEVVLYLDNAAAATDFDPRAALELAEKAHADLLGRYIRVWDMLEVWRADAYPCQASTCKCQSRWHNRVGPTQALIERTDAALEGK